MFSFGVGECFCQYSYSFWVFFQQCAVCDKTAQKLLARNGRKCAYILIVDKKPMMGKIKKTMFRLVILILFVEIFHFQQLFIVS